VVLQRRRPYQVEWHIFTLCAILCFVIASAAEAKLSALILNCKEGMIFCLTLEELGHPQPKTPTHCNNPTAVGIANNTIKWQQLCSMEMQYFWVCKVAQDAYDVKWRPSQENPADYQSKYHPRAHHTAVHPWYLHKVHSPLVLPRAIRPSTLKGCVGNLPKGYVPKVHLPRLPIGQSPMSQVQQTIPDFYELPYVDPTYASPCSIVESTAYVFSPAWHAIAINT
jgi:hypothetical protein